MRNIALIIGLVAILFIPSLAYSIETAPRISDREIIEKLARLEEGQNTLKAEIRSNAEAIKRLREDMNVQFDRIVSIMTVIVLAFAGIVAVTIGFAVWDRRTMIRPFEEKVIKIENEIAKNRTKLHSLIKALQTLSKTDEKVAKVLKSFNLL